jgi:hypothetical protein
MKPEVSKIFGPAYQHEVLALLDKLTGMTVNIEDNLSQIKDIQANRFLESNLQP